MHEQQTECARDRVMIEIKFMTGPLAGHDQPSICHSGKPKQTKCYAVSRAPGRDGWVFVSHPPAESHRNGWWCPGCSQQLREEMLHHGCRIIAQDIPLPPDGNA
jgi:hypothetical protein